MIIEQIQEHVRQKAKALGKDCALFKIVVGTHIMRVISDEIRTISGLDIDPHHMPSFRYKGILVEKSNDFGTHRVDIQFQETVRISGL